MDDSRIPATRRWTLCGLLLFATTLNYLDRQTVSVLAERIQTSLHLGNEALGWVFSAFYYAYTVAQLVVGRLLDRGRLRLLFGVAVLGWSIACALTGLARDFASLLMFRTLLALMESFNWPGALQIVALVMPEKERALANGVFTSGTSIGALIAPGILLALANRFGWNLPFFAVGSLGLFWLALWIPLTRSRPLREVLNAPLQTQRAQSAVPWRSPQFRRAFFVTILVNPALYFSLNWLPLFLSQQRAVHSTRQLAFVLTLAYLALDLGNIACGALLAVLPRRIVVSIASITLLSAAFAARIADLSWAVVLICAMNFALGVWISLYLTIAQEVDPKRISTVAGVLGASGSLAGALVMWAVGFVTERTGSYSLPLAGVAVAGILAAVAAWNTRSPHKKIAEPEVMLS
ncbi:MAG TPA: MFS transporter [Bryobacteraceae bacterium]|jgi:ACS family hexuronate transporter-like MFS transporter